MAHDIFISHSSVDKQIADAVCAMTEQNDIRCWIAPRDILPGHDWTGAITRAIFECKAVVLVFSQNADCSSMVQREVGLAVGKTKIIIPFRVDESHPTGSLEFCLGNTHWLDALTPPLEQHLLRLVKTLRQLLGKDQESAISPMSHSAPNTDLRNAPADINDNRNPELPPMFRLRVISDEQSGEVFPLSSTRNVIGRNPASDICLAWESGISRSHCALNWDSIQRGFVFVDFAAINPSMINGKIASTGTLLRVGDVLRCCGTKMILEEND